MRDKVVRSSGIGKKKKYYTLRTSILVKVLFFCIIATSFLYSQLFIPMKATSNPLSFLIIGTDGNKYDALNSKNLKPRRADTVMIATFNPDTYKLDMVEIPRDTPMDYICGNLTDPIDGKVEAYRGPINDLYELSGLDMKCMLNTVSQYLNIPLDYYIKVDLDQASSIIDLLGGISVDVHAPDGEFCQTTIDQNANYCFREGEKAKLEGEKAITYARNRSDSTYDEGMYKRQAAIINAMFTKLFNDGYDLDKVINVHGMIDTNAEIFVLNKYIGYFKNINSLLKLHGDYTSFDTNIIPESVWKSMSEFYKIDFSNANDLLDFINSNSLNIRDYFFTNYMVINEYKSGFFLTSDIERQRISDKLRTTMLLPGEKVKPYSLVLKRSNLPYKQDINRREELGIIDIEEPVVEEEVIVEAEKPATLFDYLGNWFTNSSQNTTPPVDENIPPTTDDTSPPSEVIPTPPPVEPPPVEPPPVEPPPVEPPPVEPPPVEPPVEETPPESINIII